MKTDDVDGPEAGAGMKPLVAAEQTASFFVVLRLSSLKKELAKLPHLPYFLLVPEQS